MITNGPGGHNRAVVAMRSGGSEAALSASIMRVSRLCRESTRRAVPNPRIGHEASTGVALLTRCEDRTLREAAVALEVRTSTPGYGRGR